MTIEELFDYIKSKSNEIEFDDSLNASITLNIKGSGEGEAKKWLVNLANGRAKVAADAADEPGPVQVDESSVWVSLNEETLLGLAAGEIAPIKAFLLGRVKIKGDMGLLRQLKYLWPES
jgi:putative sterol carrier protein